jgi:uncharacterized protein (DUF2267 family)
MSRYGEDDRRPERERDPDDAYEFDDGEPDWRTEAQRGYRPRAEWDQRYGAENYRTDGDEAHSYERPPRRWRNRRPDDERQRYERVRRSRSGLPVFDKSLQTTHIWINEICDELGPDKHHAWKVLSVVLHTLRDRLPIGAAAHLGAQLPLLIRGVYYDQFVPGRMPTRCNREDFIAEVDEWLADARPTDPVDAVQAVFRVLSRHVPTGEIAKVQDTLPKDLRAFWYDAEEDVVPPPNTRRGRNGRGREAWRH